MKIIKRLLIVVFAFVILLIPNKSYITVHASSSDNKQIKANIKFLDELSGNNKFVFNINIIEDFGGNIKEFYIEEGQKIIPVSTYEIEKNKYVIVVSHGKNTKISDVNLGATVIIERSEENVSNIGVLNAENKTFKKGKVVSKPTLLYSEQDKIVLAIQIDDAWDTLKNVQAILVYPEFTKEFEVSYEKRYRVVSGELRQFVYINLGSFKEDESLKFRISLFFQNGLNDVSLTEVTSDFLYNFDEKTAVKSLIESVYESLLLRNPKSSEINKNLTDFMNQKISFTNFIVNIVSSNEFKNTNISDDEFIDKIYKIILNRVPDNDGKKFWIDEIKKHSRTDILKQMLKANEYVRRMKEINIEA